MNAPRNPEITLGNPSRIRRLRSLGLSLGFAIFGFSPGADALVWPSPDWHDATPASQGLDSAKLDQARDYALTGGGDGCVIYRGYRVYSWGNTSTLRPMKSTTKSIGTALLGLAMSDGLLSLGDLADDEHPDFASPPASNAATGWPPLISLRQLGNHSAGFEVDAGYGELLFAPGSAWSYSDGGANALGEVVTVALGQDLLDVLRARILTPLDADLGDLTWRNNINRADLIAGVKNREFGSGIRTNVDVMARIGLLFLRNGNWKGSQILPQELLDRVSAPDPQLAGLSPTDPANFPGVTDHYGLLWWNNGDGTIPDLPTDAYWSWGLDESLIVVVPSLKLVVARAGDDWAGNWNGDYTKLAPFLTPLAQAVPLPVPSLAPGPGAGMALLLLAGAAAAFHRSRRR